MTPQSNSHMVDANFLVKGTAPAGLIADSLNESVTTSQYTTGGGGGRSMSFVSDKKLSAKD